MKLHIVTTAPPPSTDDVRRGIEDSAALARMTREWPVLLAGGGRVVGKRGPAFGGRGKRGRA